MREHTIHDIALSPEMEEIVNDAVSKNIDFGYSLDELRALVAEGIASGPGTLGSIDNIKAEARRRAG